MGQMFAMLFLAFTNVFSGFAKLASAFNEVATVADETAGAYADESRYKRIQATKEFMAKEGITELPKATTKRIASTAAATTVKVKDVAQAA